MSGYSIQKKHQTLLKKAADIHEKVYDLQQECKHPNLTGEYGANTGNWSPSDDCYWIDFECPDCGKRWSEDQDESGKYDWAKKCYVTKDGFSFRKVGK